MMSKIGNNSGFVPLEEAAGGIELPPAQIVREPRSLTGFTLIEAMVATMVLSLGIALIYESFFISMDAFNYYDDYMKAVSWIDDKIWQAEDSIARTGSLGEMDMSGRFTIDNRGFNWKLSYDPAGGIDKLYKVNAILRGERGKRPVMIYRTAYAVYEERE